jgi:putative ABC transport system permease protein
MPLRNVARAPRRTLITVVGIGVILALVVAFSGLIDSFLAPIDRGRTEAARGAPDRMAVSLDRSRRVAGTAVRAVGGDPAVRGARPQNVLAVTLERGDAEIDAALTTFDPRQAGWAPSLREGGWGGGVLLARQAARDLGVGVGDRIVVRHPVLDAAGQVRLVRAPVRVDGIHGSPLRVGVYGTAAAWDPRTGLRGLANQLELRPAAGRTEDEVVRALFGREGVASVQSVVAPFDELDETMDRFLVYIYAVEAFILLVALLVAFNSAAIGADERRREHATMFAYGVPRRTVLLQSVAESAIVGVLAVLTGVAVGLVVVGWIVHSVVPETLPDLELEVVLAPGSLAVAAAIGVLACALAPLFTARRLRTMDVASTLRVME